MSQANIQERVAQILARQFRVAEVKPEHHIDDDFGADSLDHVEILIDLEEEFGIEISDEEAEPVRTVAEIVRLVESKLA